MQSLLERGLVRIAGRAEVPGRPLLYETTQIFMQHFGLRTLDELPNVDELRRVRLPSVPTTGELFPNGSQNDAPPTEESPADTGVSQASASVEDAPQATPDASSELPPEAEPDLTQGDAESVPAEPPSTDHVADSHS